MITSRRSRRSSTCSTPSWTAVRFALTVTPGLLRTAASASRRSPVVRSETICVRTTTRTEVVMDRVCSSCTSSRLSFSAQEELNFSPSRQCPSSLRLARSHNPNRRHTHPLLDREERGPCLGQDRDPTRDHDPGPGPGLDPGRRDLDQDPDRTPGPDLDPDPTPHALGLDLGLDQVHDHTRVRVRVLTQGAGLGHALKRSCGSWTLYGAGHQERPRTPDSGRVVHSRILWRFATTSTALYRLSQHVALGAYVCNARGMLYSHVCTSALALSS